MLPFLPHRVVGKKKGKSIQTQSERWTNRGDYFVNLERITRFGFTNRKFVL